MADSIRISIDELKKRINGGERFTIVDVRNPNAWAEATTKATDAVRVPLDDFQRQLSRIPKDRAVVAYCT